MGSRFAPTAIALTLLPSPSLPRLHAALALALALAFALLAACTADEPAQRAPAVPEAGFVVVQPQSVPLDVVLAGRTRAFEVAEIRPQVSGIIRERLFDEGALVKQGQTLYRIDSRLYRAAQAEARAALASAVATREATKAKAERLKPLADMEAVSRQDYTDALGAAREADAAVARVRAQLDTAAINLGFTDIKAPITGRIGRSVVTTGALVSANQAEALTTIQRLDPIFVDMQQSSAELLALRRSLASGNVAPVVSAAVGLELEDGSRYSHKGLLQFAEAVVDPATGSVTLRARFANPSALLLPGMFVRALLVQATAKEAILVPQQGVLRDARGQPSVMLVGSDGKALQRTIRTERTVGDRWLVSEGLQAGDRVIGAGLARIKPGQPVTAVAAALPGASGAQTATAQ